MHFTGIAPGAYMVKFYAREGIGGGSIEFQAPGPFDQTLPLTFFALPTSAAQCKNGGWETFGVFENQGDCVSFVATSGKNPPNGLKMIECGAFWEASSRTLLGLASCSAAPRPWACIAVVKEGKTGRSRDLGFKVGFRMVTRSRGQEDSGPGFTPHDIEIR